MVITTYGCEKCNLGFSNREKAEEHERKPIIIIPEGFVYFINTAQEDESIRGLIHPDGFIRGHKTGVYGSPNLNSSHSMEYFFHALTKIHNANTKNRFSISLNAHTFLSTIVRNGFAEGESVFGHRFSTDEEAKQILSDEEIVSDLKNQGLTELTLDLEGERTVPIVYSEQPILT